MGLLLLILALWLIAAIVAAIVRWWPPTPAPLAAPPPRRPVRENVPHALYDYPYAGRAEIVYVGISNEPQARDRRHANDPKDQWWYRQSAKRMVIVGWYPNRDAAKAAERARVQYLARLGHDLANDHHNPVRRVRRAA
jgi:predicted GIY-YIG superfamily endonuclease